MRGIGEGYILGIYTEREKLIPPQICSQEKNTMNSIELLFYAVVAVLGTLAIAAAVGYVIADRLDKKNDTD